MRRIVILGGGFAGSHALLKLEQLLRHRPLAELKLISRTSHLLFTPALPEVVAGTSDVGRASVPIRRLLHDGDASLVFEAATRLDTEKSRIHTADGATHRYDALIIALGAVTDFSGVPGAREHATPVKNLRSALELRTELGRVSTRLGPEDASHIVVVGGGAEGVEVAAAIAAARNHWNPTTTREEAATVTLVERGPRLVPDLHESLAAEAQRALEALGVDVLCDQAVEAVEPGRVLLSGGRHLAADPVLWCAGVKPPPLLSDAGLPLSDDGRIRVDSELRVRRLGDVYAIGDAAYFLESDEASPLPRRIEIAMGQANCAAQNVHADLTGRSRNTYHWTPQAEILSLGPKTSAARIRGVLLRGRMGWSADQAASAAMVPSLSNKLAIVADWGRRFFGGSSS